MIYSRLLKIVLWVKGQMQYACHAMHCIFLIYIIYKKNMLAFWYCFVTVQVSKPELHVVLCAQLPVLTMEMGLNLRASAKTRINECMEERYGMELLLFPSGQ